MQKTSILKDDLDPGSYERGWIFFIDPQAHAKISNSELRKVFIDIQNESANFENLKIGTSSNLLYKNIELNNIIMKGQWPITMTDANVSINNSDYLFIQISGQSSLYMKDSHMVEFIPRDFLGTITFENCVWTNAGEIIGGQPYHSMVNNFTIKGSLKISSELREHLQWKEAQVTREYDVIIKNKNGDPIKGAIITIDNKNFVSDDSGKAKFNLTFNEFNYTELKRLEVFEEGNLIAQKEIDFFTETPIIIIK